MRQEIKGHHFEDSTGNPAGGNTLGVGIDIVWQNGPLGREETRKEPNGAFVEGVIATAIDRIEYYQRASGGKFACDANAQAIHFLNIALERLDGRTKEREARQVEGTHTA